MWTCPRKTTDMLTFTKEILNGKPRFLCSDRQPELELELAEASLQRYSYKEVFWRYAANLQKNTNANVVLQLY